ncbi:nuclear transport factor 2 family protein [Streptacidiphilus jiangxiensis]|uniref:Actinorhodin biosynthesis protein ActVIA n=1 Tax=Streptacidiphilus jiangxiensis TaxID=235985 RepID=A0A1H7JQJ0_STRJI|nr:nuclear transport factor 2 family protein [Streptacidiphilus jiangxiensis]SEK75725.1 actinorhodin biosynthesis protein ActVIA [Streptacidiphilus jiangxiensis]
MTITETSADLSAARPVSADLYAEVQQFYARQVQLLDAVRAEEFAATFAEDGVFEHSPDSAPASGRAGIAAEVRDFNAKRFAKDPVQRRHWFNMLVVEEQPDGSLHTQFYALVMMTRPGELVPVIAPSCVVRDVLVREDGALRTRRRKVSQDRFSF